MAGHGEGERIDIEKRDIGEVLFKLFRKEFRLLVVIGMRDEDTHFSLLCKFCKAGRKIVSDRFDHDFLRLFHGLYFFECVELKALNREYGFDFEDRADEGGGRNVVIYKTCFGNGVCL